MFSYNLSPTAKYRHIWAVCNFASITVNVNEARRVVGEGLGNDKILKSR